MSFECKYLVIFYDFIMKFIAEASVRTELMEQVPPIALYCQENPHIVEGPIPTYILPIIVKYLIDSDNQVGQQNYISLI